MLDDASLYLLPSIPNALNKCRYMEILFGNSCELQGFLSLTILKKIKKTKLKKQKGNLSSNFIA